MKCEFRQKECAGKCPCTLDGRDIIEHAESGDCPKQKFPSRGIGDTVAKALQAVGVDRMVKAIAGKDCGCKGRQEKLNQIVPYDQSQPDHL